MSASRRQKMHVNSLAAWHEGNESLFSKREILILRAFANFRTHATDREIMLACGFSDMNSVRPRITELIEDGILEEHATKTDPITKKNVRISRLRNPRPQQAQAEFILNQAVTPEVIAALQPSLL